MICPHCQTKFHDDTRHILDSILCDWFNWARGYQVVAGHGTSAMFAGVRSSRQWDAEHDIVDGALHNAQMEAVDFQIGELPPLQRTALGVQARNLHTGHFVWTSARLPADAAERAAILADARAALTVRLVNAGVM